MIDLKNKTLVHNVFGRGVVQEVDGLTVKVKWSFVFGRGTSQIEL